MVRAVFGLAGRTYLNVLSILTAGAARLRFPTWSNQPNNEPLLDGSLRTWSCALGCVKATRLACLALFQVTILMRCRHGKNLCCIIEGDYNVSR